MEVLASPQVYKVSVMFGGAISSEYDASVASFRNLVSHVDAGALFTLGDAYYVSPLGQIHRVDSAHRFSDETVLSTLPTLSSAELATELLRPDVFVFNLLHGQQGEDGEIAGWAAVHGISGSFGSVISEALAMNKWACAPVASAMLEGAIRTPRTLVVRRTSPLPDPQEVPWLHGAVIIKPGSLGASIKTTRLPSWDPIQGAALCEDILEFSDTALVQECVEGQEYSCGVLAREDGMVEALPVVMIGTPHGFYDHTAKHAAAGSTKTFVSTAITDEIGDISCQLFTALGLFGWARFDYIVNDQGIWFLEVNTLPGIMSGSLYPAMLAKSGRRLSDLIDALITARDRESAQGKRHEFRYRIEH